MAKEIVAKVNELRDGDKRAAVVGGRAVLLVKAGGKFYAIGAKCTHYGGPLAKGVVSGHRVLCPWHQACFDAVTGGVLDPPALDAVPHFAVRVEGDNVIVTVPDDPAASGPQTMPMVRRDARADNRTFVIVGGGAAGNEAAETLRQEGFRGRIVVVTHEHTVPYDRPKLSKTYLASKEPAERPVLRPRDFYADHDIELMTGREVASVDATAKSVSFADGASLRFDAVLLATGGVPRRLDVPGGGLQSIFTLRSLDDCDRIIAAAQNARRAVVIGASFIGMETAASLTERGLPVTVVAPDATPFERTLGKEIGAMFQKLHEENGVTFRLGAKLARFEGTGKVEKVVLENGDRLDADLVIAGVGVRPATDFLKGWALNPDGSVPVDLQFRAADGVYAAGDIAQFPDWRTGERIRIEHWRLAEQHGRVAARNMLGRKQDFVSIPFFWTNQFGVNLRYVGYTKGWDEIIFHGDPAAREFVGFYVKGGKVLAAAGVANDMKMVAISELMRIGRMPSADELRKGQPDLVQRLKG